MTLIRRLLLRAAGYQRLLRIARAQQQLLEDQRAEIQRLKLEHHREIQGIVSGWIINLESPEIDMRDELHLLLARLADHIAVLEEHVA